MADYTTKSGESLANMKVGFIGRDGLPVDLTNATVAVNVRKYGESVNTVDDGACTIVSSADGVVTGPPTSLAIAGDYQAVFKVSGLTNGPHEFPSSGVYRIQVEDDLD